MTDVLLRRLAQIGHSLEHSKKAVALIGLGSVGLELERTATRIWISSPSCNAVTNKPSSRICRGCRTSRP
jgi:hypothetical protein